MKRSLPLLCLLACLAAGAQIPGASGAPGAPATPVTPAAPPAAPADGSPGPGGASAAQAVSQFQLANGLTVIVKPDKRAPTAVNMLWLRTGSIDEVDGTSGVAHALEHMMFKGSRELKPGEFSRQVAALGGRENAFTNQDYTGYYQQIPANRLEDVMRLEADRFAHSEWPDDEFKREIEVIKEERRMRTDDNPRARLVEQLNAAAFVASPYHRPVIGWMNDLDAMTPDDVRQFYRQWYVPRNAAVVVAGDVDVAQVRAWAEKYFGAVADRPVPARKPRLEPAQLGIRRITLKAPAEQAFVALAFKVPSLESLATDGPGATPAGAADNDALALTVLEAVLDGYRGARLDRALTQGADRVADSASANNGLSGRGPQMFLLSGIPARGKTAAQVEAALRAEVARVARDGVSEAELARVKTQWVASQVYERDSVNSQATELGSNWVQGFPLDASDRLITRLRQVTAAQVKAVAARYFGDDQLTVGTLVPQPIDPKRPPRAAGGASPSGAAGPVH